MTATMLAMLVVRLAVTGGLTVHCDIHGGGGLCLIMRSSFFLFFTFLAVAFPRFVFVMATSTVIFSFVDVGNFGLTTSIGMCGIRQMVSCICGMAEQRGRRSMCRRRRHHRN
jgi:hypothetical protein